MITGRAAGADGTVTVPGDALGTGPATIVITTTGTLEQWPATVSVPVE